MKKSLVLVVAFLGLVASSRGVEAASYQTPLFPWAEAQDLSLKWRLTGAAETEFTIEWQSLASSDAAENWQPLTEFKCLTFATQLRCQATLPQPQEAWLQLRLTYPQGATLDTFNLDLENEVLTDRVPSTTETVFYSNFKSLDPAGTPAQYLAWREVKLVAEATDQILLQTRASYNQKSWTPWSGNYDSVPVDLNKLTLQEQTLTLADAAESTVAARLAVTYRQTDRPYYLKDILGAGDTDPESFANLSFNLTSLDGLQLGETISVSQTVAGTLYRVQGIISDLKVSENLVSVFSWQGVFPTLGSTACQGKRQCLTSEAQVVTLPSVFLAWEDGQASLPPDLSLTWEQITEAAIIYPRANECLETTVLADACQTYGLSLAPYYQQADQVPQLLQYRLINGVKGDVLAADVFLFQGSKPKSAAPETVDLSAPSVRLRGGKVLDQNSAWRPTYWR